MTWLWAQLSLNIETEKMKKCWEEREKVGKAVRTSGSKRPKGHCGDKDKAEIGETGRERE